MYKITIPSISIYYYRFKFSDVLMIYYHSMFLINLTQYSMTIVTSFFNGDLDVLFLDYRMAKKAANTIGLCDL